MTVSEAIAYIENQTWSKTRLGLGRTRTLLGLLGDPQRQLKFIHVTGSNGKGSCCAMFDAVLRAAGYRTGLYTSPYLEHFCERIRVDGENIPEEDLARLTVRVKALADGMDDHPSQFELLTAIAMEYFRERQCEIVALEVGMGGALDSTNAIDAPELAVIANIGLEHTQYLGDTLEKIAETKAGIIKPGCACVCYDGPEEAVRVIRRVCREKGVPLERADFSAVKCLYAGLDGQELLWRGRRYRLGLPGGHQLCNAALVLTGLEALRRRGWVIPETAAATGLRDVKWSARLEVLGRRPLFLLDGGHNPQCAAALSESLKQLLPGQRAVFLTGVLADKDYGAIMASLLPHAREFLCVTPDSPRALPADALRSHLEQAGAKAEACSSVPESVALALERAGKDGVVVAFGSLYLAGAIRGAFRDIYSHGGI